MLPRDPIAELEAWQPWPSPPVAADAALPHQVVLRFDGPTGRIMVSCNCLRTPMPPGGGGRHYQPLGVQSRWEPGEPIRLWRQHMAEVTDHERPAVGHRPG